MHRMNLVEVGLLGLVELLLCTSDGCRRNHIDESRSVVVDETDTFFGRFGRDEHDDAQVVMVGDGLEVLHIVLEGKVGNDDTIDTHTNTFLAELLEPKLHDGVEIAHEDERKIVSYPTFRRTSANTFELREELTKGHTVAQRLGGCILDNRPIGHRVAERNADLDHGDAVLLHSVQDLSSTFKRGGTRTEVETQQFLGPACKQLIDSIHSFFYFFIFFNFLFFSMLRQKDGAKRHP